MGLICKLVSPTFYLSHPDPTQFKPFLQLRKFRNSFQIILLLLTSLSNRVICCFFFHSTISYLICKNGMIHIFSDNCCNFFFNKFSAALNKFILYFLGCVPSISVQQILNDVSDRYHPPREQHCNNSIKL